MSLPHARGGVSVHQAVGRQEVGLPHARGGVSGTTGSTRQKKLILASLIADAAKAKDDSLGDANGDIFASLEHAGRPALLALLALLEGRPMGNEDLEA